MSDAKGDNCGGLPTDVPWWKLKEWWIGWVSPNHGTVKYEHLQFEERPYLWFTDSRTRCLYWTCRAMVCLWIAAYFGMLLYNREEELRQQLPTRSSIVPITAVDDPLTLIVCIPKTQPGTIVDPQVSFCRTPDNCVQWVAASMDINTLTAGPAACHVMSPSQDLVAIPTGGKVSLTFAIALHDSEVVQEDFEHQAFDFLVQFFAASGFQAQAADQGLPMLGRVGYGEFDVQVVKYTRVRETPKDVVEFKVVHATNFPDMRTSEECSETATCFRRPATVVIRFDPLMVHVEEYLIHTWEYIIGLIGGVFSLGASATAICFRRHTVMRLAVGAAITPQSSQA